MQRFAEVLDATKRLELLLEQGRVRVSIGTQGALAIVGWNPDDRKGISDACAYRALSTTWAMRQALARAETLAGRKLDQRQVALGTHSHDGGATWHPGH